MADLPIEIDILETKTRKANAASVRQAALARVPKRDSLPDRGLYEPELEVPPEAAALYPQLYPDNNPAWDNATRMGVSKVPTAARQALVEAINRGETASSGMVDEYILQMRMAGLRHADIARRLGDPFTEAEVVRVLARLTKGMEKTTASEMRMLQVARLEAILNMCWNLAAAGSVDHIELLIKTLERLGKVFDLESERTVIEVQYVTDAQVEIIVRSTQMAVDAVVRMYEQKFREAGFEPPARDIIDGTVAEALGEASDMILTASRTPLVLERAKGGGMQLRPENDKLAKDQRVR